MRQGELGLLLARHRPETAQCLYSIASSKFVFHPVFIFQSGNSSSFPDLFLSLFIYFLYSSFLPFKMPVSFDSGATLKGLAHADLAKKRFLA